MMLDRYRLLVVIVVLTWSQISHGFANAPLTNHFLISTSRSLLPRKPTTSSFISQPRSVSTTVLKLSEDPEDTIEKESTEKKESSILDRFLSPKIDDPGLPLTDVLVAQIIGPSLEIAWLSLNHAPSPSWLRPIFQTSALYTSRGSLLAPALIHGAALATCWIIGALAAKTYELEAIVPNEKNEYGTILWRVCQAGAFASGLLILATQLDLLSEFGRWVQLGESEETDFRLLLAAVELINDIFFEAITLITWRLFLASQSRRPSS